MATIGTYYEALTGPGFPAVVIRVVQAGKVLVKVWTDAGDLTLVADEGDTQAPNVFVPDS